MPVINCKFCEGRVEYQEGELTGVCNKCHTTQTLPDLKNEENINLYNKATLFIRNYEFDEAQKLLTQLLSENSCDAEIYWNLALCCYGITYENDITAKSIVPVIHRIRDESFYTNQYYSSNVRFWGETNKNIYKSEAKIIENKLDKVLALADKAGSFDIYISCRIKDEKDRITDKIIGKMPFNEPDGNNYMKDNITWENCSLRKSLNTEFYNSFSEKEKSRILNTKLDNEHVSDPENICNGKNVTDRIFLLSYDDIDKYFAFPTDRIAFMVGEDRKIKDIYHFDGEAWLLRSIKPNYYTWRVTTYLNWGDSTLEKAYGIRPALYLKY